MIDLGTAQAAVNIDGTPAAVAAVLPGADDSIYVACTVSTASAHSITVTDDVGGGTGWVEIGTALIDGVDLQEVRVFCKERPGAGTYNITATIGNPDPGQTYAGICAAPILETNPSMLVADGPGQLQVAPGAGTDAITSGTAQTPAGYAALVVAFGMNTSTGANAPDAGTGFASVIATWDFGLGGNSMRLVKKRITSGDAQGLLTAASGRGGDTYLTQMAVFRELQGGAVSASTGWLTEIRMLAR